MGKHSVEFRNQGKRLEILLYDVIGDDFFGGISAKEFRQEIVDAGDVSEIEVRINSPGGNVFDGFAIFNTLAIHPAKVTTFNDGLAASAAATVMMAGSRRVMTENSSLMIHKAMGVVFGTDEDMLQEASLLTSLTGQIADIYAERSGNKRDQILEWMGAGESNAGTWWTGAEALQDGFATELIETKAMAASLDRAWLRNIPERIIARTQQAAAEEEADRRRSWEWSRNKLPLSEALRP